MQTTRRIPRSFLSNRVLVRTLWLLAVVSVSVWGKTHFFAPLPRGAYPVLSTLSWAKPSPYSYPQYHWLPDGDLAYLERNPDGRLQVCYQKMNTGGPVGPVRRGQELPTAAWDCYFYPSPDEQRIAYFQLTRTRSFQTYVISADTTTHDHAAAVGAVGEKFSVWLPDSRSFLAGSFTPRYHLKVYHLESHVVELVPPTTPLEVPIPAISVVNGADFLIGCGFDHLVPQSESSQNSHFITLRSFSGSHPTVAKRTWKVPVPTEPEGGSVIASPDKRHLLWYTVTSKPSPQIQWLRRLHLLRYSIDRNHAHYFLSDLYGNHRRPILEDGTDRNLITSPQWTPDSKHLSFVYKEQLYMLPVD
ncbi:MAG: hypothetical protein JWL77_5765 [Chthonomonadaceae bacterium]|nr:hypothetical protein [Chthonomonadaceae bacterium]